MRRHWALLRAVHLRYLLRRRRRVPALAPLPTVQQPRCFGQARRIYDEPKLQGGILNGQFVAMITMPPVSLTRKRSRVEYTFNLLEPETPYIPHLN